MTIDRNGIFSLLLASVLITTFSALYNINIYFLNDFVAFTTLFIVPGTVIFLFCKIKDLSFWETVSLIIGFSLTFIMVLGLCINQSLVSLGIPFPLSLLPVLTIFDLFTIIIAIFAYRRNKNLLIHIPLIKIKKRRTLLYLFPPLFILLSIGGAVSLNNNGPNFLTMLMLASIGLYIGMIASLRKKIPPAVFPFAIYCIALSLLLMTSLRSWYISGHDIQREYFTFQLTKHDYVWNINAYKDAYNASMSITVLPVIIANFIRLPDVYIYKLIYQIVFAICPVIIYLFLKKYTQPLLSFFATLYFISFPTFYNDMPMLNRQEIGFIFFSLILFITFNNSLSQNAKRFMFIIFVFSTIISHYSTNYVLIFLFVSTYSLGKIVNLKITARQLMNIHKKFKVKPKTITKNSSFITTFIIIVILFCTFFWNTLYTKTSNNLITLVEEIINDLVRPSKIDSRAGETGYSLFMPHKATPAEMLNEYVQDNIKQASQKKEGDFFNSNELSKYSTHVIGQSKSNLTSVGMILHKIKIPVFQINAMSRQIASALMQLFVFIGLLAFIFYANPKPLDKEYLLLCLSGIALLVLQILVPKLSTEYGLLRMFQQLLTLLSLPIITATMALKKFVGEPTATKITAGTIILFFLTLTGFFSTLTGGFYPQMNLDNDGLYFDAYYVTQQISAGIVWLKINKEHAPVQSDSANSLKLFSQTVTSLNEIFPPIIRRNAYVFLAHADSKSDAIVSFHKSALIYNSPEPFLNDYKSLIYNNGTTKIYK